MVPLSWIPPGPSEPHELAFLRTHATPPLLPGPPDHHSDMSSLHDQAIGLFVFFTVLTTITVGLRLFVRMKLCKGAFGWDDIALVVTWVSVNPRWKSVQCLPVSSDLESRIVN